MEESRIEQLSARESEILRLVGTGATNQQIAAELSISVNTVKTHLRNIFAKLHVESRTEATVLAIQQGWVAVNGAPPATQDPVAIDDVSPLSSLDWPIRLGQWLTMAVACLVILGVGLWPALRAQPAGLRNRLVDVPRDAAPSAATPAPSRWAARAQMPTPRGRFAQVAVDNQIYVLGGLGDGGWTDRVEVYDPGQDLWSRRAPMPEPLANIQAVELDGLVYVPGGLDAADKVRALVWLYHPDDDLWTAGPELPEPRCGYGLAAVGDAVYVIGGWDGQRYVDTVYRLRAGEKAWTVFEHLDTARGFLAATTWDDVIVVCGGYDGETELALVEVLDPQAASGARWQQRASMNVGRAGHAVVMMLEDLYVVGGGWDTVLTFNERYDVGNDAWSAIESPVVGEWSSLGLSLVESEQGAIMYAVGGWDGSYLASVQAYQAVFRVYVP